MILLLDDDPTYLELTRSLLEADQHKVAAFTDPTAALQHATNDAPDLVVCDIVMPEMDGHEFQRRYQTDFAERRTPFLFLSSVSDPAHIIQALDEGAVDYVAKPVDPGVLCAKVRSQLRRRERHGTKVFRGNLSDMGLPRLFRHCEESGLTGSVEVGSGEGRTRIIFRGGRLDEESAPDDVLAELFDLTEGEFTVVSEPASVEGLNERRPAVDSDRVAPVRGAPSLPAGRISGVRIGERLVQIQTEAVGGGARSVVAVAVLDGRTLLRRETEAADSSLQVMEQAIGKLHVALEEEVRRKLAQLTGSSQSRRAGEGPMERFAELYRQGIENYEDGNYAAALMLWEMAVAIDPTNRALTVQIEAARKKALTGTCMDAEAEEGAER